MRTLRHGNGRCKTEEQNERDASQMTRASISLPRAVTSSTKQNTHTGTSITQPSGLPAGLTQVPKEGPQPGLEAKL